MEMTKKQKWPEWEIEMAKKAKEKCDKRGNKRLSVIYKKRIDELEKWGLRNEQKRA